MIKAQQYAADYEHDACSILDASERDERVVEVIDHWEREETELRFADGSSIIAGGPDYEIKE